MSPWLRIAELLRVQPRGKWIEAGTETDYYVAIDRQTLELKPGVRWDKHTRPGGTVVYQISTGSGDGEWANCRCPKGFHGDCQKEPIEGAPQLQCKGTCAHDEVDYLTTECGWFSTGSDFTIWDLIVSILGIFGR